MSRVGFILAAGNATRFGGHYKELSPIGEGKVTVDSSFDILRNAGIETVYVTTNPRKAGIHAEHFSKPQYGDFNIALLVLPYGEMVDSLILTLPYAADENIMLMADTVIDCSTIDFSGPISFGAFRTQEPKRFSVFESGKIVTKPEWATGEYSAWGCVTYTKEVAEFWRGIYWHHYDAMFNAAIEVYGLNTFEITRYWDLGSFEKYREYLNKGVIQ